MDDGDSVRFSIISRKRGFEFFPFSNGIHAYPSASNANR